MCVFLRARACVCMCVCACVREHDEKNQKRHCVRDWPGHITSHSEQTAALGLVVVP